MVQVLYEVNRSSPVTPAHTTSSRTNHPHQLRKFLGEVTTVVLESLSGLSRMICGQSQPSQEDEPSIPWSLTLLIIMFFLTCDQWNGGIVNDGGNEQYICKNFHILLLIECMKKEKIKGTQMKTSAKKRIIDSKCLISALLVWLLNYEFEARERYSSIFVIRTNTWHLSIEDFLSALI